MAALLPLNEDMDDPLASTVPRAASPSAVPWLAALGGSTAWLVSCGVLGPFLPLPARVAFVVGFASVSAAALWVGSRVILSRHRLTAAAGLAACLGLASVYGLRGSGLVAAATVSFGLLTVGSLVGAAVGSRIEHPGQLLFVAPLAAAADLISVHHPEGVSAAILSDARALSVLALPFPMLGTAAIEPLLGVGDVVFVSLYLAVARRHALSVPVTVLALAVAFAVTAGWVLWSAQATPALPMLGAAMLLAHSRARRPRAEDRLPGAVGLALAAAALVWFLGPS